MVAIQSAPPAQDKLKSERSVWRRLEGVLAAMGQEEQATANDPRVTAAFRGLTAIGTTLCAVGITSMMGTLTQIRDNQIRWEARIAMIESASKTQGLTHKQLTEEVFNLRVKVSVLETESKELKRRQP